MMHDILIAAKGGLARTNIMYKSNLSWTSLMKYVKLAKDDGLIEDIDDLTSAWRTRSLIGLRTTEKGLKYARSVYEGSKVFQGDKDYGRVGR